ncbi:MAG: twin-arginine translocation signal domain-containing protein [Acidimicrobiia bacterium]
MASSESTDGSSRRELLKKAGLGGAVFLGGSVLGHTLHQAQAAGADYANPGLVGHSTLH